MTERLKKLLAECIYRPEKTCPRPAEKSCEGCIYNLADGCDTLGRKADYLLANGVIVLPCKVGDVVYRVSFVHKHIEQLNVEGFLRNLASWKAHCTHTIPSWLGNQKEHIYISFSSFGKTVFLTSEEAEKALAERKQK